MSRIEQLIAELCPDGVEYKDLSSFTKITTGKLNANAMKSDGLYPFFTCSEKPYLIDNYAFDTEAILISGNGSQLGHINYFHGKFNAYQRTYVLYDFSKSISTSYLIHYLKGYLREYIWKNVKEGSVPYITLPMLQNFILPIPPLPIQQEIVRILDTFTDLDTELQAELEARKKQYEHYRNQLLNFEGKEVEWKTLGDFSKILRGKAITEKETTSGIYPVVANAPNPIYFHGEYNRSGETIVISRSGAYSGLVSYWNKPFFLTDAFSIHPKSTLFKTKFVYYYLKNRQDKIHQMQKGSGVPHVRAKDFETYSVPIPPLAEQERIVSILDKFEALLIEELPAEIAARRKQYEYYREKLLTFEPLVS